MPDGLSDVEDNTNNFGLISINWVGNNTELVVDSRIVKLLTRTGVGDTEEILTEALPSKIEDVNNITIG